MDREANSRLHFSEIKVEGTQNKYAGVAVKALADPSPGCKM